MPRIIGVGTSPLMLLRAARLAEGGAEIVLLDRSTRLGGAWAVDDVLGFSNVELGVHLLENRPELYRALARELGVQLSSDPCVALVQGRVLPMRVARAAFHAAVGINSLRRFALDSARRSLTSAWRAVRNIGVDFCYPTGGASRLLEMLSARLQRAGGEIRLGQDVLSAAVDGEGVRCETSAGPYTADGLLVSSRACPPLRVFAADMAPETERRSVYSTVISFRAQDAMRYSYVEILGDRVLRRVRDLGPLIRPRPNTDERVWCVQGRAQGHTLVEAGGQDTLSHLCRLGLVEGLPRLVGAHRADLHLTTVTDRSLLSIAAASRGRVEVLRTTDFADGFVTQGSKLA